MLLPAAMRAQETIRIRLFAPQAEQPDLRTGDKAVMDRRVKQYVRSSGSSICPAFQILKYVVSPQEKTDLKKKEKMENS